MEQDTGLETARIALSRLERDYGNLATLLLRALHTDGAHHKQWYLERALRIVRPYETGDWVSGIKP